MQLEETAGAKDVPPLSSRGVFELPEDIAQNNTGQITDLCGFLVSLLPVFKELRSPVY
jgi:hypothetical protein